jgi:hypothetical protein
MTATCTDPRLWHAGDPALASAHRPVPAAVVAELRALLAQHPELRQDPEHCDTALLRSPAIAALGEVLRADLRHGPGFCRLSLPQGHSLDAVAQRLLYLALGCELGSLMTQYGRLYAVKDRGADYRTSMAPVSMTSERTGFHTDSSARDVVPDYVALLCESAAAQGGDSLVSNALGIREVLLRTAPGVLERLEQAYVRDLVTPGREQDLNSLAANRFPVFASDATPAGVTFRYMRYWLERGQQRAGVPVGPEVLAALDRLDEMLQSPEHVERFRLASGDMLFVNNRTLAHDRTAFVDDPTAPRLLWRMWVEDRGSGVRSAPA